MHKQYTNSQTAQIKKHASSPCTRDTCSIWSRFARVCCADRVEEARCYDLWRMYYRGKNVDMDEPPSCKGVLRINNISNWGQSCHLRLCKTFVSVAVIMIRMSVLENLSFQIITTDLFEITCEWIIILVQSSFMRYEFIGTLVRGFLCDRIIKILFISDIHNNYVFVRYSGRLHGEKNTYQLIIFVITLMPITCWGIRGPRFLQWHNLSSPSAAAPHPQKGSVLLQQPYSRSISVQ